MKTQSLFIILGCFILCVLSACGGSGSSTGYSGAANVNIDASPQDLDVGDRTTVELDISDVNSDGIILKIRYPIELEYIAGTAKLYVDGDSRSATPSTIDSVNDETYLVFRITESNLGDNNHGTLAFQLRGASGIEDAKIAIDPDVDSTTPFDPQNPEFETLVDVSVNVSGS